MERKAPLVMTGNRDSVLDWNIRFPIDLWWRNKYKIPFGSPQHLDLNWYDLVFEYEEHLLMNSKQEDPMTQQPEIYVGGSGEIFKSNISYTHLTDDEDIDFDDLVYDPDTKTYKYNHGR